MQMKKINDYINEALAKNKIDKYETILKMINGSKINKEDIKNMIIKLNMNELKEMSQYLYDKDLENFIAYKTSDDDFINQSNHEKICFMISEYLYKYVSTN